MSNASSARSAGAWQACPPASLPNSSCRCTSSPSPEGPPPHQGPARTFGTGRPGPWSPSSPRSLPLAAPAKAFPKPVKPWRDPAGHGCQRGMSHSRRAALRAEAHLARRVEAVGCSLRPDACQPSATERLGAIRQRVLARERPG